MGRLTNSDKEIPTLDNNAEYWLHVYFKLKDYEDITDDPEKLKIIDAFYQERCEEINELRKIVAHYKELISNGILRVMPCKVGDKAYHVIYDKCAEPQIYISEHIITDVSEKSSIFCR